MVIFNSLILLILDFYIYKGLRATRIKFPKHPAFPYLFWGFTFLLLAGVALSIYVSIPIVLRSYILVVFFCTFITKFIYAIVLLADDLRRGGVWLTSRGRQLW